MAVMERTGMCRVGGKAESQLAELARGLAQLAHAAIDFPGTLPQVERGFRELSDLARTVGDTRAYRLSRAFAAILANAGRAPEGDRPVILSTAARFLGTLRDACVCGCNVEQT